MAKEDKGESFSSSAGLMRYFDSEDQKGIKISPKTVVALAIAFTILIIVLPVFVPVN
ncbi:MAG: preprotein translocase subunit Sec61beta [Methanomethylophilus sp.]|jgi:preprotein translocase subunit Sec61beta